MHRGPEGGEASLSLHHHKKQSGSSGKVKEEKV